MSGNVPQHDSQQKHDQQRALPPGWLLEDIIVSGSHLFVMLNLLRDLYELGNRHRVTGVVWISVQPAENVIGDLGMTFPDKIARRFCLM